MICDHDGRSAGNDNGAVKTGILGLGSLIRYQMKIAYPALCPCACKAWQYLSSTSPPIVQASSAIGARPMMAKSPTMACKTDVVEWLRVLDGVRVVHIDFNCRLLRYVHLFCLRHPRLRVEEIWQPWPRPSFWPITASNA